MSTEQTEQQIPTNGGAPVINTPPEEQTIMTPIDTLLASAPTSLSIEGVGIDTANLDPDDYFDADGYVRHCINCISESYEHTTYNDIETTIDGGDLGELDIRIDEVEVEIEIASPFAELADVSRIRLMQFLATASKYGRPGIPLCECKEAVDRYFEDQ